MMPLKNTLCLLTAMAVAVMPVMQVKRPRITGVSHMAVYVSDLDRSRSFYGDLLGLQNPYTLKDATGARTSALYKVNDDQYIELLPGLKAEQDRLAHIAFSTDDAGGLRQFLEARGVTVPPRASQDEIGDTAFAVKDPEGHEVEFKQYLKSGRMRTGTGKFIDEQRLSSRILHVGIIVGNANVMSQFYSDVLGLKEFWRGSSRNSQYVSWINMRLPESEDYIEYMLYEKLPAPTERGSQHHICLEVPDMQAALARLEGKPGRKNYTRTLEIRTGINRRRQLNLFDPDGTRIELMEPTTIDGQPAPSTTLPLPPQK